MNRSIMRACVIKIKLSLIDKPLKEYTWKCLESKVVLSDNGSYVTTICTICDLFLCNVIGLLILTDGKHPSFQSTEASSDTSLQYAIQVTARVA